MPLLRAILIDPETKVIDVRDVDGSLEMTRHLVGAECLGHFRLADHDSTWDYGWVSDDGLLRGEPIHAFKLHGRSDPLAGRCLVTGAAKVTGANVNVKITVNFLKAHIDWLGRIVPEVFIDPTEVGFRTIITYAKAK